MGITLNGGDIMRKKIKAWLYFRCFEILDFFIGKNDILFDKATDKLHDFIYGGK